MKQKPEILLCSQAKLKKEPLELPLPGTELKRVSKGKLCDLKLVVAFKVSVNQPHHFYLGVSQGVKSPCNDSHSGVSHLK